MFGGKQVVVCGYGEVMYYTSSFDTPCIELSNQICNQIIRSASLP